ncbi:MAG: aminoacyl-histidine dipeptidase [Clostridiales bacterium]|nr:aminoacyl-histidine dipeptidase [Clostridiales bacterium]
MQVLNNLKPQKVFEFFEEISRIPRGSGNTDKISEYCVEFAKKRGLWVKRDEFNNVIIKKPASKGYEDAPAVVLQGHLDMVCIAEGDFDFENKPIPLVTDGEWVWAEKTTLGGDDGVAIAMGLAILDSDRAEHPKLEVLFTSDEETGMDGAAGLDASVLEGNKIINIDSEDEGIITVGCAGGIRVFGTLKLKRESLDEEGVRINISGLLGGHSGVEINAGRINALKAMAELLSEIKVQIADIQGGARDNAIPALATAIVYAEDTEAVFAAAKKLEAKLREEYAETDGNICIECLGEKIGYVYSREDTDRIISILKEAPDGVQSMSKSIEGLVQTSSNLGVAKVENDSLNMVFLIRSSVNREKDELCEKIAGIIENNGGITELSGGYGAWEYRENSPLRDTAVRVFSDMYGYAPRLETIHAGLECGILAGKIEDMDCISIGPDLKDIHTPKERMNVKSVERVYNYVLEILKRGE